MLIKENMIHTLFTVKNGLILLDIVLTTAIFYLVIKLLNKFVKIIFENIDKKNDNIDYKKQLKTVRIVTISTIDTVLMSIAILHILETLGINVAPIVATAGVLGLAVGFGAKKFVEDLISGMLLLLEGQIRVGDVIEIQGVTGVVEKINLRLVIIRDLAGAVHFYRNSMIDTVTNYTRDFSYALFDTSVAYKENIANVIEVIKNLSEEFSNKEEFKDIVIGKIEIFGLDKFDDSAIVIKYRIKTKPAKQWIIQRAFNLALKEKFDELNIEIPFPQRVITNINK